MKDNFSPMQNYALAFLRRVGCASVQQMDYILGSKFGITTGQSINVLHSLEQYYLIGVDKNDTYVTLGTKGSNSAEELNMNTIMALQVALDMIDNDYPEDFDYIYKPYSGMHLRFYTNDTAFEIFVTDLYETSLLRYLDERGRDKFEADKTEFGESEAVNLASKYIITFPYEVNKKTALSKMHKFNMFMPHTLAFIDGDKYFEKQSVDYRE